jgi:hypothetical protein
VRIGAVIVFAWLVSACDRGRAGDISKDPARRADATTPIDAAPDAATDGSIDASLDADARAIEPPPIEIHDSAAPKTSGPIPVAFGDVDALAKAVAAPFGACYHDALARDPMTAGVLVVRFSVLTTGAVDAPAAGGKTLRDPELLDCVVRALRRLDFSPPPTIAQTVTHAFAFRPL